MPLVVPGLMGPSTKAVDSTDEWRNKLVGKTLSGDTTDANV